MAPGLAVAGAPPMLELRLAAAAVAVLMPGNWRSPCGLTRPRTYTLKIYST